MGGGDIISPAMADPHHGTRSWPILTMVSGSRGATAWLSRQKKHDDLAYARHTCNARAAPHARHLRSAHATDDAAHTPPYTQHVARRGLEPRLGGRSAHGDGISAIDLCSCDRIR